jgi:hypothetical protein
VRGLKGIKEAEIDIDGIKLKVASLPDRRMCRRRRSIMGQQYGKDRAQRRSSLRRRQIIASPEIA